VQGQDHSLLRSVQIHSDVDPASYPKSAMGCFLGIKRQKREVDRSSPYSVEIKNSGCVPLLTPTSSWLYALLIRIGTTLPLLLECVG
jgi:hypothetical protein